MTYKQIVTKENILEMLRPDTNAGQYDMNLYHISELEFEPGQLPITYAYSICANIVDVYKPQPYSLRGGLYHSLMALKPTFDKLKFTPIAFVDTEIHGPASKSAYVDLNTQEYDMRKHETHIVDIRPTTFAELDNMLKQLSDTDLRKPADRTKMYKFILRDKKTNKIMPMPYYIAIPGDDVLYDRIATDKKVQQCFIAALQKMRHK